MDRLTKRLPGGIAVREDLDFEVGADYEKVQVLLERLAAYEDLGTVEELAALKERTKWIPVSERMPKINGAYRVFRPTFHNSMCFSICYFDGQNTWHDSYGVDFMRVLSPGDVTHWMPLPEAPKEM